jgi:Poly(ADP-ribose) polymerase and DNA-Ligase Zn-finger region
MAHVFEAAATGRSKCRGCGERIAAGMLRFGESLPNLFAEGDTTHWFHPQCAAYKRPEPILEALEARTDGFEGSEDLKVDAKAGIEHHRLSRIDGAERAPTGRAACRACKTPIEKGAWRIPLVFYEEGRFSPAGSLHPRCAPGYFETADLLSRVRHFAPGLSDADLGEIQAEFQPTA